MALETCRLGGIVARYFPISVYKERGASQGLCEDGPPRERGTFVHARAGRGVWCGQVVDGSSAADGMGHGHHIHSHRHQFSGRERLL